MTPAVITIVRVGAWALVGIFTAFGLVTAGTAVVLPAAVAAGLGAFVGFGVANGRPAPTALRLGAACGAGVPAVAGLAVLAGPATLVVALALVAILVWTHRRRPQPAPSVERSSLMTLSNAQLAHEWHASYRALARARDPLSLELICALRRRQLDELERRAPGEFHRWISSGSWVRGDSAPFLGG